MMILRPYQKRTVELALAFLKDESHTGGVCVAPTASGKSLMIASLVKECGYNKILILQPTADILSQNAEKLKNFGLAEYSIFSASFNKKEIGDEITLGTIKSVFNKSELFLDIDLLIVDEAHFCDMRGQYAKLIRKINRHKQLNKKKKLKIIGFTATPYRMKVDRELGIAEHIFLSTEEETKTIKRIFTKVISVISMEELYKNAYLSPLNYTYSKLDTTQLRLNTISTNYTEESVSAFYETSKINQIIKLKVGALMHERKHFLVFVPTVKEAEELVEELNNSQIKTTLVTGKTPRKKRNEIMEEFKSEKIKCIVNVGVYTVGFDFPNLDCIVLARPLNSLMLHYQILGRGMRKHWTKKNCLVIDLVGNVKRLGKPEHYEVMEHKSLQCLCLVDISKGRALTKLVKH